MKISLIAFVSLGLGFWGQTAAADINETAVSVNGQNFCGGWRFSVPASTDGFGCKGNLGPNEWSTGQCEVILPDGQFNFQIRAREGSTIVRTGGSDGFRADPVPMITSGIDINTDTAFINFNLVDINIKTNGYLGLFGFEGYEYNVPGRCEASPVAMPVGTTSALVIGAHFLVPVHISNAGLPFPTGTVGLTQLPNNSIEMNTVDVVISPEDNWQWRLNAAAGPPPDSGKSYFSGQQTIRLVIGGLYSIQALDSDDVLRSEFFSLAQDCRYYQNAAYVPNVGVFNIKAQCIQPE